MNGADDAARHLTAARMELFLKRGNVQTWNAVRKRELMAAMNAVS